jgi:ATP-dependent exoDNAse (exonuclease V) beta subunit
MTDTNTHNPEATGFPHAIVLKASAGSGKTHALTRRFVEFLLSEKIKKNNLRNLLAITFSNNAAAEMRSRILEWLKALALGNDSEIAELGEATGLSRDELMTRAGAMITTVLEHYADLQVKTIDSFMTGIFKTFALDLGYNPDFEVVLRNDVLMGYAFDSFLKNVREKSPTGRFLQEMVQRIMEAKMQSSGFPWDPSALILNEIRNIYRKAASTWQAVLVRDLSPEIMQVKGRITEYAEEIEILLRVSGLEPNRNSSFPSILGLIRQDGFPEIIGRGLATCPVRLYKGKDSAMRSHYENITKRWADLAAGISRYAELFAEAYYFPYLKVFDAVRATIESVKKKEDTVFIEDINRTLAEYMEKEIVPDVYFRIGETVFHYLIDEFQDTSPVQWKNLFPLVENSLSQNGSLFVVGDTKQAIYGFRDADYRIMREMEVKNPFPSARHMVKELETNFRSLQGIVDFNDRVFKQKIASDEKYGVIAGLSGLTGYIQKVRPENEDKGHVRIIRIELEAGETPESREVRELLSALRQRGYGYRDIAVLTFENEDVVNITSWLNEAHVPFISYSSLDVRRRKIIVEIVSLLRFLDSPLDDLSFSTFLLGDLFGSFMAREGIDSGRMREFIFKNRRERPLYKRFQEDYPELWSSCFAELFRSSGFLPLYDLVTCAFRIFDIFLLFREEEAALAKMLEVVKNHEQSGRNSLRDFIEFVSDEDGNGADWNIDVPREMDAVKVMTVHKAKGLGFPVVVLLVYGKAARGFDQALRQVSGTDSVCFTRLNRKLADIVDELGELYGELTAKEIVNSLNSLYVALTRAESEMYVVCVRTRGVREGYHACTFLPYEAYMASDMPHVIYPGQKRESRKLALEHGPIRGHIAAGAERSMKFEEKQWGEYVHRVLFHIDTQEKGRGPLLRGIISKAAQECVVDYPEEAVYKLISGFLDVSEVVEWFTERPGRIIGRETEVSDAQGHLFRIDRLVIGSGVVTVIDFKTGRDIEPSHIHQVRGYMGIMGELYPEKKVEGMIAYVELATVVKVI